MKIRLGLTACAVLLLGSALQTQAHSPGGFAYPAGVSAVTVPRGATVGPQNLPNGGSLVNNGTINGGSSTAVTAGGPNPVTITNNGSITSSTGGIATSGNSSSTVNNNGSITVGQTVTSTTGNASATVGTGISQRTGP